MIVAREAAHVTFWEVNLRRSIDPGADKGVESIRRSLRPFVTGGAKMARPTIHTWVRRYQHRAPHADTLPG